jgi:hypothetical protein
MKQTDIAYIAGLVDGEGYIGIRKTTVRKDCFNHSYHARIQIRMVDEPAIKFITDTLGGNYYREKPHCNNGKPLFCYQSSDKKAEHILQTILPYLKVKKRSAETVLQLRKLQRESVKHKTKITGYREFPNSHGTIRMVPNLAHSEEYIAMCDAFYVHCKQLNRVGV